MRGFFAALRISDLRPDSVTYRDGLCGYRPTVKKLRRDGVFLIYL
jgi:hypothetical protein